MTSTSTARIVLELRTIFARWGLLKTLVSDNGPQLVSAEFDIFCKQNGIRHIKSAPFHPSTNGEVEQFEAAMKSAKSQNREERNMALTNFLLMFRTTKHASKNSSPVQLL